jgi:phage tail-like protein
MALSLNQRGSLTSDPIRNFRFLCTFMPVDGTTNYFDGAKFGFTSVSGLSITTESIPYREGQYNTTVTQVPGQSTFSPITFQRGVTIGSRQNWDWMKYLFSADSPDTSRVDWKQSFRVNITVDVLAHPVPYANKSQAFGVNAGSRNGATDDTVLMKFKIFNAWPTSVAYSDLSAGDNALLVEQMTVVHEGFNVAWAEIPTGGTEPGSPTF